INERKQVYENRPYGLAHEKLHELLFPAEHPYSWPTIGYTSDLEVTTLEDARSFYSHFYAPDNAVLVLAGDLGRDDGFGWAERYFGDLPGSGIERGPSGAGLAPVSGGVVVLEDRVTFPRL